MDVKRYFEILELPPGASIEELNQAYKDLVNIWHPDRFSNNPRLKRKAEEKLKEVNRAYEAVKSFLSSESGQDKNAKTRSHGLAQAKSGVEAGAKEAGYQAGAKSKTEAVVRAGTLGALSLWSYLSTRLRRVVADQIKAFKEGAKIEPRKANQGRNKDVGRGKGKGN